MCTSQDCFKWEKCQPVAIDAYVQQVLTNVYFHNGLNTHFQNLGKVCFTDVVIDALFQNVLSDKYLQTAENTLQ